jgi:hypothetical protein
MILEAVGNDEWMVPFGHFGDGISGMGRITS